MKKRICKDMPGRCKHINVGRLLFLSFLCVTLTACFSLNACAAGVTVWQKAEEIMKDVYNHILAISTIAGIVTAAIALLMLSSIFLSLSPKGTVLPGHLYQLYI